MPLFSVRGKFADNHTFSVNPVDGEDAAAALASIVGGEEVKAYGQAVVAVTVTKLEGKKRVRISDEPAKPREAKAATPAAATTAATPPAPSATSSGKPAGTTPRPAASSARR